MKQKSTVVYAAVLLLFYYIRMDVVAVSRSGKKVAIYLFALTCGL